MDEYLHTPAGPTPGTPTSKMAPPSPASSCASLDHTTLADIGADLKRIAASMVTKDDLQHLSTTLHEAIKLEVAGLKTDDAAHETRIHTAEQKLQAAETHAAATDTALKRQGALILAMRRQLEDQDNRGRRNNIRVRGVPESPEGENVEEILTSLFRLILKEDAPARIKYDRAHRALRPRPSEGTSRDIICCLHSFPLKELIMAKARPKNQNLYHSDKPGGEDGTRQIIHLTTPKPAQRTQKNNKPANRRRWAAPEDPRLSNHRQPLPP
ncbi:Hypothetical predicted protein [Pelobates cultripes]|uniref:Uncharacterized protein n=1 Tax=Pelobates cultripes TaxID=61616 RepID=A0AAD1SV41_PELCU|nr:Hypothetical predicted protein [Pelobates cultripes]